jgi:hypothetical protein
LKRQSPVGNDSIARAIAAYDAYGPPSKLHKAPVVRRKKQADAAPVGSKQASKSRLSMRKLGDDDEDDDDNDNTIGGGSGIKSKFVDLDEDEDDAVASKQVKRASVTQKHAVAGALM